MAKQREKLLIDIRKAGLAVSSFVEVADFCEPRVTFGFSIRISYIYLGLSAIW